jgi:predicted HTH transcriptional regulator
MTTDEFEKLIEGATETQRIYFKKPVKWDVYLFIKDFLAMSNVQDGGWIIIGIEEDKKNNIGSKILYF